MLMPVKKIISLPVYTQSGQKLGRVIDVNLDIDNHGVFQYIIGKGLVEKDLYLARPIQVIEISDSKMTVDDAVIKNSTPASEIKNIFSPQSLRGVVTSNQE